MVDRSGVTESEVRDKGKGCGGGSPQLQGVAPQRHINEKPWRWGGGPDMGPSAGMTRDSIIGEPCSQSPLSQCSIWRGVSGSLTRGAQSQAETST